MITSNVTYMINDYNNTFFFSTDHIQEFIGSDRYVPVSVCRPYIQVRSQLKALGYTQIQNPDEAYVPAWNRRSQRKMQEDIS